MSRVRHTLIVLGLAFAVPALLLSFPASDVGALSGTWRSATDETPLNTAFDESVWGKNAKAIRTVEMVIRPTGDAALTVNRKVIDARGRAVLGSASVERVDLTIGPAQKASGVRSDLAVTVKKAERHYPDDPKATWTIEGMQVTVTTFTDDPEMLEVRLDLPEGRGSFWESLRRGTRKPTTSP